MDNKKPLDKNSLKKPLKKSPIRLMTHLVAGYPSFADNLSLLRVMEESGVEMIEIQIPFSDPIADGETITSANFKALAKINSLKEVWDFIEKARQAVKVPLLIMTYYNIPFRIGFDNFFQRVADLGIDYVIIPDLPFDEKHEKYFTVMSKFQAKTQIKPVIVVSPTTSKARLRAIKKFLIAHKGMLYTTLKVGTTGAKKNLDQAGVNYLKDLRKEFPVDGGIPPEIPLPLLPLAAGFGISSPEQARSVSKYTDLVVIGSHIINLFEKEKLAGVRKFLKRINK